MWPLYREALRGMGLLSLGIGSLLAIIDRWVVSIPVDWIGGAVLFYLGIGSGVWVVKENDRAKSQAAGGDSLGTEPEPPHVSQRG